MSSSCRGFSDDVPQVEKIFQSGDRDHAYRIGRKGKRFTNALYDRFDEAVEDVFQQITSTLDSAPFFLFGHSMGSWLALEVTYQLIEHGYPEPKGLFLSGRRPPHVAGDKTVYHTLSNDKFIEAVLKLGGANPEVFENEDLAKIFIPILRSDFKMLENYTYNKKNKLTCDLYALMGEEDALVSYPIMEQWKEYSDGPTEIRLFNGGHFYLNDREEELIRYLNSRILVSQ